MGPVSSEPGSESFRWRPSGSKWKDYLHFCGPGWFVAIAYVDPGNYQADIQAGASSDYNLLWTVWWASILSIYVQVLCARLATYGQITLAEVQAQNYPRWFRYISWAIAEFSVVITDLPEVIGIGIAFHIFFGWPYYVGVLLSPITTMLFLASQEAGGMRYMEGAIVFFISVMSIALWIEQSEVPQRASAFMEGWVYGFALEGGGDVFAIIGVIGAVVMPHNLYLHTASVMSRPVERTPETIRQAARWTAVEPVIPILVSFFINAAILVIAAEEIYRALDDNHAKADAGLTEFADYLKIPGGGVLFGIALLAAGQSSAVTTTYSGQYIMEGFLNLQISPSLRAVLTRLVALVPCILVSVSASDNALNTLVNYVNALLAVLLPFALTPLVKFSTSTAFLGEANAPGPVETCVLWTGAFLVYAVNAFSLSAVGGGFFGDVITGKQDAWKVQLSIIMDLVQILYLAWNVYVISLPILTPMRPITDARPVKEEGCFGVVGVDNEGAPLSAGLLDNTHDHANSSHVNNSA